MTDRPAPKMTHTTREVLRVFLTDPARERHGFGICQETGLASGTVTPILHRLAEHGWLTSREEGTGRIRRYYRLTPEGVAEATARLGPAAPVREVGGLNVTIAKRAAGRVIEGVQDAVTEIDAGNYVSARELLGSARRDIDNAVKRITPTDDTRSEQ
ncbi:MAG: PadR family transcriptional regulator [Actinomycetia bacterium]|nr:PadR family transcriptional regulator [Actinomycetes bacterium]